MATRKELDALIELVSVAAKVNASSDRVNVEVEISHMSVGIKISDPVEVLANHVNGSEWDWLFYHHHDLAYFSDEVFSEEKFIARCQEFVDAINGFEGRTVQESA